MEYNSVCNRTSDKQNRCRPIFLITSTDTMTDQIGLHEVLLPVNHTITKLYKGKGKNFPGRKHNSLFFRDKFKKSLFKGNFALLIT